MRSLLVGWLCCVVYGSMAVVLASPVEAQTRVATFRSDITPPLGYLLISGDPLETIESPLEAKGIVLEAQGTRYVLCALDWCEVCNGTHLVLRKRLAEAAGADVAHVAVQCVHQHTAPVVDVEATEQLVSVGCQHKQIDAATLDQITARLATAVKEAVARLEPFDSIGAGQAKVERVAATRRVADPSGKIRVRWSKCKEPSLRAEPEGNIDPYLKTITLARAGKPLVRLHYYATHPQSSYGDKRATSDVAGDARESLQRKEGVVQIYFNGCGGDITMGKYNDGSKPAREELASRLLSGMEASVAATKFAPVGPIRWRTYPLVLPHRTDKGFSMDDCLAKLKALKGGAESRFYSGGVGIAFQRRSGEPLETSSLEIGSVHMVHLPGEPMICFQHYAQSLKPGEFVAVAGYADGAPGYLCSEKAFQEGGYEPTASRVKPESESLVKKAVATLLGVD